VRLNARVGSFFVLSLTRMPGMRGCRTAWSSQEHGRNRGMTDPNRSRWREPRPRRTSGKPSRSGSGPPHRFPAALVGWLQRRQDCASIQRADLPSRPSLRRVLAILVPRGRCCDRRSRRRGEPCSTWWSSDTHTGLYFGGTNIAIGLAHRLSCSDHPRTAADPVALLALGCWARGATRASGSARPRSRGAVIAITAKAGIGDATISGIVASAISLLFITRARFTRSVSAALITRSSQTAFSAPSRWRWHCRCIPSGNLPVDWNVTFVGRSSTSRSAIRSFP